MKFVIVKNIESPVIIVLISITGMKKAEWGLDSVTIGVNETNLSGFQDDFGGMMPDMFTWFQTESAIPRITCNSKGNALEFSRNSGKPIILVPVYSMFLCF